MSDPSAAEKTQPNDSSLSTPHAPPDRLAAWLQFPRRVILLLIAYGLASALIGALPGLLPQAAILEGLPLDLQQALEQGAQTGELISLATGRPVAETLGAQIPNTYLLLGAALVLALLLALPLVLLAVLAHKLEDSVGLVGSIFKGVGRLVVFGLAARPVFALGLFLLYVFAIRLSWLPAAGMGRLEGDGVSLAERLPFLILPALTLALFPAMLTAQAVAREMTWPHLSNGWPGWVSGLLLALGVLLGQIGGVISAVVLVEMIFSWPGIGRLMVNSTFNQDYPMLMGLLGAYSGVILTGRLAAEFFHWLARLAPGSGESAARRVASALPLNSSWRNTARKIWVIVALALLLAPLALALAGLTIDPEKTMESDLSARLAAPSAEHPLGTDELGRDLLARVLRGALTTLGMAALATGVVFLPAALFGALTGVLAAGRKLWSESLADGLLLPADVLLFFPTIPGGIVISALFGKPAGLTLSLIVALLLLPRAVRFYQNLWLTAPQPRRGLVVGGAGLGALILGALFTGMGLVAALDFLGLGTQPPQPSLVAIMGQGLNSLRQEPGSVQAAAVALWLCAFPCYTAADALVGFFNSKESLARLNE